MNIFEASSCAGIVTGAIGGSWLGFSQFGWTGALIGLPVGVVLGWIVPPFIIFATFLVLIFFEEGPSRIRKMFRGEFDPDPKIGKVPPDRDSPGGEGG